jgi:hypothetical protein
VGRIRYFYAAIFSVGGADTAADAWPRSSQRECLRPTPAAVSWLLRTVLKAERLLVFPIDHLAGLSVVGIART